MASELENWWTKSYGSHSIRDLQALPVFQRFSAQHYPYDRTDENNSESFKTEGPLDTFQWQDKVKKEGEVFSHERVTDTWTYEHRFREPEHDTVVKAVLTPGAEWGEITRTFASHSVHESWKLQGATRTYETFTLENGEKNGMRAGQLPATDGQENWIEKFFEKPGQSNFERTWERPGAKGGENKQSKDDLWWGEVWHTAGEHTEKKVWHIQGDKDWGHTHGEACGKVWDEKWEIEDVKRSEEKIIQDGDRKRGFRYIRNGKDWYKQEWDGLKVVGVEEELEKTHIARFRGTVDELGVVEYDGTLKGEHTLQLLLRDAPHFVGEVEALKAERLAYPNPDREDVNSLLDAHRYFGALNDKQERLKQRMIEGRHSDINLYLSLHVHLEKALTESQATLQQIAKILEKNPEAKVSADEWEKEVEKAKSQSQGSYYGKAQLLLKLLENIETEKRTQLEKFVGGIDKEEVRKAMETLYRVMVEHDAVSDKIIELVPDSELKAKLDGFQDQFEDIHKKFLEESDPNKLHQNLELLLDYQPIHQYLVGRLRGYNKEEVTQELGSIKSALEETKTAPSLKNTRAKVRSGRGAKDSPFQLVDRALNRLVPFFITSINHVRGDKSTLPRLEALTTKNVDSGEPFEIIIEKAHALADAAEAHAPLVDTVEAKITESDEKLDVLLQRNVDVLQVLENNPELLSSSQELLERHYPGEDLDLILAKIDAADAGSLVLVEEFNTLTETVETTKTESNEFEIVIEQKSEEIAYLTRTVEEKDKHLRLNEEELLDLRKYKSLFESKDNECTDLSLKVKKLQVDVKDLELQIAALTGENGELKGKVRELEEFKSRALDFEQENVKLKGVIKNYEEILGEKGAQFQEIISTLNQTISERDGQIKSLQDEIERLKSIITNKDTDRKKQLMLRVIVSLSNTLKAEKLSTYFSWKAQAEHEPETLSLDYLTSIPELKSTVPTDEQEWTESEFATYTSAEKPILSIRETILRENIIFKHMRNNGIAFEQPMPVLDFYRFLEEILVKKLEADNEDFGSKRRPANLPGFVFDTLLKTKGARKLAQRDVARLIPTLYGQFSRNSTYGVLFARLLNVFHHSPAPLEGLVLVTRYNKLFLPLIAKLAQDQAAQSISPKSDLDQATTGGEASLEDVLEEFYVQVGPEPVYQRALLRYIKPVSSSPLSYLLFLVKWYLYKTHHSEQEFWGWAETASGNATTDSLIEAVTVKLGLNVSPRLVREAVSGNTLDKAQVFGILGELNPSNFLVTKAGFLTGILEGFLSKGRRIAVELAGLFAAEGAENLTKEQLGNVVRKLNPEVSEEVVGKMYEFGSKHSLGSPVDQVGYTSALLLSLPGKLEALALTVPELHQLFDTHVFEFDLETGVKTTTTKTTTTKVVRTTVTTKVAAKKA